MDKKLGQQYKLALVGKNTQILVKITGGQNFSSKPVMCMKPNH
jgi:hypothetical protein